MNIQDQKIRLAKMILETDSPTILELVKSVFGKATQSDFSEILSDEQKAKIEQGLSYLVNEDTVEYESLIKKYRILKIYVDTSVFGGYYDDEFSEVTRILFDEIKKNKYQVVISDLTEKELISAPENVKNLIEKLNISVEKLIVDKAAIDLAMKYISEKVVGATSMDDCIHIATATINRIDVLVSWNFKHIVNIHRIKGYNSINNEFGYENLEIRSPKDLINHENIQE
jgi:predicted nucleic acid-binding protein